jgi:hypothetical protein
MTQEAVSMGEMEKESEITKKTMDFFDVIRKEIEAEKREENKVPFLKRINDICCALKAGALESALALTLTLPDVCGMVYAKATKSTSAQYKKWIDEYVIKNENEYSMKIKKEHGVPHLSIIPKSEVIWQLRCKYLHQHYNPATLTENQKNSVVLPRLVVKKFTNGDGNFHYLNDVIVWESQDDKPFSTEGRILRERDKNGFYNNCIPVLNVSEFIYTICGYAHSFYKNNVSEFEKHNGYWLSIYETDDYVG